MPTRPHRFAIAGFQHESNSFGAGQAGLAEFEMADSWPGLLQGVEVISGTLGINLPIAGFVQEAQAAELVPILWCAAEPSAPVTAAAFDEISQRILNGIASAGALDGLYLDLHGAMITELHDDGEGELLRRIRGLVGPNLPIVISLDMHANVTGAMVAHSDAICMFRTYPHLDMAATGARCANVLVNMAQTGGKPAKAFRTLPFLIPLHAQDTNAAPAREIYAHVQAATDPPHSWVEFAVGFTAGDSPHTGPSVLAYGPDQAVADASAEDLHDRVLAAEASFAKPLLSPDEAVRAAMQTPKGRPL